jgi:hypothetical protein
VGWLRTEWLPALIAVTAAGVVWVELIVWAVTARHPDPALTGLAGSLLAAAAARAGWRIMSAGGRSSSQPSPLPPSSPPSPPLPEASDGS